MMDPLAIIAVTISACAFGVDVLLLYRQMHVKPWNTESPEADPEAAKEAPEAIDQSRGVKPILNDDPNPVESSPLNSTTVSAYDTLSLEEKSPPDAPESPSNSASTPWPPPDAPKWFWYFGWKTSQRFLSPAERPPVFSRWYHGFKILYPPLIIRQLLIPRPNPNMRELHPQEEISIGLFMGTISVKLLLIIMLGLASGVWDKEYGTSTMYKSLIYWLGMFDTWCLILWIFFRRQMYWKTRAWGNVSGIQIARLRMLFCATVGIGLWTLAWRTTGLEWKQFGNVGMTYGVLVGLSYGIAWERWV
ncbi:MAG: hypothetical protein L6R40_007008 [Gallowayella cf. fulva]|nr:MAG: hypothetical protein L6R40_007008 [Xanthomendoza cf. fulva]